MGYRVGNVLVFEESDAEAVLEAVRAAKRQGLIPTRGRPTDGRVAHNHEAAGSTPVPATKTSKRRAAKRLLPLLVVLLLTGCSYVNIGDSVGMPGAGTSYVDDMGGANYAVPGSNLSDISGRLEHDQATRDAVANATLLTISAGGNDVMWYAAAYLASGRWTWPDRSQPPVWIPERDEKVLAAAVKQFHADWERMADDVTTLTKGRVIVLTIYDPFVGLTDATARHYLVELNVWIAAQACARGWLPARVDVAFNGPDGSRDPGSLISMDGLHPSEEGQHVIVAAIAAATCG